MNDKALVKIFFSSEEEHPEHISEVSIKKALPLDKEGNCYEEHGSGCG